MPPITSILPAQLAYTGEGTPYSPNFDDIYHSADGGPGQARHVFLRGNRLPERWRDRDRFTILETGFGTGLNFLATWAAWHDDPQACRTLHYLAVEKHPFSAADLAILHRRWPELAALSNRLRSLWPVLTPGFHRLHFAAGRLHLTLLFGEVDWTLARLSARIDAVYLDGFAPRKNPDMWSPRLYRRLARLAAPDATLATWCVAAAVRDGLEAAGFRCEKRPGYGHKRDMLTGHYAGVSTPDDAADERRALVVGAGLAGSAVCARLAARGWQISLIERHAGPAREASGNLAGIVRPLLSVDDNIASRFTRAAYLYTLRGWQQLNLNSSVGLEHASVSPSSPALLPGLRPPSPYPLPGGEGALELLGEGSNSPLPQGEGLGVRVKRMDPRIASDSDCPTAENRLKPLPRRAACGVLQIARDAAHEAHQRQVVETHRYPTDYVRWQDRETASALAGWPLAFGGWHFPHAGWAHPPDICAANLKACGDRLNALYGRAVARLERVDGEWRALDEQGRAIAAAPVLILASGAEAARLTETAGLPLRRVRGQVTHLPATRLPPLALALCREGYVTPAVDGLVCAGASYALDQEALPRPEDDAGNLTRLEYILPGFTIGLEVAELSGRVGFRSVAPDRLPLVGALPTGRLDGLDREVRLADIPRFEGGYGLLGLASRGLVWAQLSAELLAAQIEGEPLPLEMDLAEALDPARFLLRRLRRGK